MKQLNVIQLKDLHIFFTYFLKHKLAATIHDCIQQNMHQLMNNVRCSLEDHTMLAYGIG